MSLLGLRVDVCTFEGLQRGVPPLLDALARHGVRATFFTAMGPDRSGRAVLRVFRRKGFLGKMLRTRALRLYGLRTLLAGTLLPAPSIARGARETLSRIAAEGHEAGIHSWDHVRWQDRLDELEATEIRADLERAREAFAQVFGRPPEATAAPAWLASERSLLAAEDLGFRYASDTRGAGPFRPVVHGRALTVPQVPVTLPTLDERLGTESGRSAVTAAGFYADVLERLARRERAHDVLEVLAVHAELEGRAYLDAFEDFLERVLVAGGAVVPLGTLLSHARGPLPECALRRGAVPGRAGEVSLQGDPAAGQA